MTEQERIQLYNDLCDFKADLLEIRLPPQTKNISTVSRAIEYVRGVSAKWLKTELSEPILVDGHAVASSHMKCSCCRFDKGESSFRFCPKCGARMK